MQTIQLGNKSGFGYWCLIVVINAGEPQVVKISKKQWDAFKSSGVNVEG